MTWPLDAGIDGIEHGFYLTDAQLDQMTRQGTVLCPTLSVVGRFGKMSERALPPGATNLEGWRQKAVANAWKTVSRAHQRGVRIICGTDVAMPYLTHGSNAYELEMLVEAGLSPSEALVAATAGAADGIGFADVGRIEAGRFADFVLVNGDPLQDIRMLQERERIVTVIKGGDIVVDRRSGVQSSVTSVA